VGYRSERHSALKWILEEYTVGTSTGLKYLMVVFSTDRAVEPLVCVCVCVCFTVEFPFCSLLNSHKARNRTPVNLDAKSL